MSYTALARKWRPRTFETLVGQEHVRRPLMNALARGTLHHAFLFSGTRGVGKTTIARILAKCLNCESGITPRPCGECSACAEIDEGRFVDLIEVDAASRTKVDDTRALLDNVQYLPARGRFKVYLIDEVHMLSAHSFNALLKTLEEPPPHVKFLLATTDPQKLPVTVLSRCLQFNLKRLPASLIAEQLARVLAAEGIKAESEALDLLAAAADGSMRDALSLLDQAIAFGGGELNEGDVRALLGVVGHEQVRALLEAVVDGDGKGLSLALEALKDSAPDYEGVLDELTRLLQRLAWQQVGGVAPGEKADPLAQRLSAEDVQLFYQICLHGKRDMPLAPDPDSGFEMVVLRLFAFRPDDGRADPKGGQTTSPGRHERISSGAAAGVDSGGVSMSADNAGGVASPPARSASWEELVSRLALKGVAAELAANCVLSQRTEDCIVLALERSHAHLRTEAAQERLRSSLAKVTGQRELRLKIDIVETPLSSPARRRAEAKAARHAQARESIENDTTVKALRERFSAEVVEIKALK